MDTLTRYEAHELVDAADAARMEPLARGLAQAFRDQEARALALADRIESQT